jgi:hypothetical protein
MYESIRYICEQEETKVTEDLLLFDWKTEC